MRVRVGRGRWSYLRAWFVLVSPADGSITFAGSSTPMTGHPPSKRSTGRGTPLTGQTGHTYSRRARWGRWRQPGGRSVVDLHRQRRRRLPGRLPGPLDQLAAESFSSADLVLLCSFGPDLVRPRSERELRHALLQAGYRGPLGRHLVLTSRLLERRGGNRYGLQPFAP